MAENKVLTWREAMIPYELQGGWTLRNMVNEGFQAGLAKRSKVERIAWAWKGAERRTIEKRLNPMEAIVEGRKIADGNAAKLAKHGIAPKDTATFLVFAERENLGKLAQHGVEVFLSPDKQADAHDLTAAGRHILHVPIGLVVCVLDREKRNFIAHARPWILQDPPLRLLETIVADVANLTDWRVQ
jgi:hypothetical protein